MGEFADRHKILLSIFGALLLILITRLGDRVDLTFPILVICVLIIIYIAFSEIVYAHYKNWKRVKLSEWSNKFPSPMLWGLRVENNTLVNLKDCKAELYHHEGDAEIELNMPTISEFLRQEGFKDGNSSLLYWLDKNELKEKVDIDKGNTVFLVIAFELKEEEKQLNWFYRIAFTSGSSIVHPFDAGYVYIEFRASPFTKPIMKRVRLEALNSNLYVRRIENV